MNALTKLHQEVAKIADLNIQHIDLAQRATEAQNKATEAEASISQVNALKVQRRNILGLIHLGQTKETTVTLDVQIAEAEIIAAQQTIIAEGALSASEMLTEQAHKVWLEADELRKNIPALKYQASVEIAESKAVKYQKCAEELFVAYAEMTGTARLAYTLSDPLNGLAAIEGMFNLLNIVELPIVSGLKSFNGFSPRRDLMADIDDAKSKAIAKLENKHE